MTPLHLRRRLRAVVTMIAGEAPDDAAEARAVYRTAYDCGDDEPIAELMRQVLDEVTYQKRARDATDRTLTDAAEESYKLRTELADVDEALYAALDIRPDSLQAATMYAPGGVRRLAADRDVARGEVSILNAAAKVLRETLRDTEYERDAAVDQNRRLLGYSDELAHAHGALDAARGPESGVPVWERVYALASERDEAVAMISTLRGEHAAAVDERDKALDSAREAVAGEAAMRGERDSIARLASQRTNLAFMDGYRWGYRSASGDDPETRAVHDACDKWIESGPSLGGSLPKRKRTKEERAKVTSAYLANLWTMSPTGMGAAIRRELALMGPSTSRDIATRMWARVSSAPPDESEIRNDMRWVQDFARAGYLTVAKGPGGVRVYGLKEGA